MTGPRRTRRFAAAVLAGVLLIAVPGLLLTFPPEPVLRAAARHFLPDELQWSSVGREGSRIWIGDVRVSVGPASLSLRRVALTHSLFQGLRTRVWEFEGGDALVSASDPRWPVEMRFARGTGAWDAARRRLVLERWGSGPALISADLGWDADGRLTSALVSGEADPAALQKMISAWKPFKNTDAADAGVRRSSFEIRYDAGQLLIRVDGKPFFKAAWRLKDPF